MKDSYDISQMAGILQANGTQLVYEREVTSTMDIGADRRVQSAVVLTDHQTSGRGRYSRKWDDSAGSSVLATFVKPVNVDAVAQAGTLAISQLCVLAVHEALRSVAPDVPVKIKWPNDLTIDDAKLGGVLLMEGAREDTLQNLLFGVGLNVYASESGVYQATHLNGHGAAVRRGDIIVAIDQALDSLLPDLARLSDPAVRQHYNELWRGASALLGRAIRITDGETVTKGTVVDSPFGANLQLRLSNGSIIEISRYGHGAHLEIVENTK